MIQEPMDVLHLHPVRKNKKQKQAFREDVRSYLQNLGYSVALEKGSFGAENVVVGDPAKAKYLLTAHYDTCARLPIPNLITPCNLWLYLLYQIGIVIVMLAAATVPGIFIGLLTNDSIWASYVTWVFYWLLLILLLFGPANQQNANDNTSGVVTVLELARSLPQELRERVCFVFFDLEEAGLLGSAAYQKAHKEQTKYQTVLNLDCVGDGDTLMIFPTGKLKKDTVKMGALHAICGQHGKKNLMLRQKGISIYPSDQSSFPYGAGIAAFHNSNWAGLYLSRIHTNRDTILDETNIDLLKNTLINYLKSKFEE